MTQQKQIHSLILDAGPIIKNDPSVSTLIQRAESLLTVPAVISEIKDAATRARVATTLEPFLTIRSPNARSMKIISDFARRTGDLAVLSRPDIEIIALTYDLECERNGGDWRLRSVPGQKRVNGAPPSKIQAETQRNVDQQTATISHDEQTNDMQAKVEAIQLEDAEEAMRPIELNAQLAEVEAEHGDTTSPSRDALEQSISELTETQPLQDASVDAAEYITPKDESAAEESAESDSDSDGWITPSNLKKHQVKDASTSTVDMPEATTMQAAVLTSDYAMQNVILQMNLNLLSPSMQRIKHMKTFVLRCHACFQVTKDMSKQFCPRCGQSTLTRVACSTDSNGEFKLHLKKNMQWNNRGDRYSVPKPVHGAANGRVKGGGKGGWGNELILAEDQKEYDRARAVEKRQKERNLMDEDYLPSILTGDRGKSGGRIKVGAGRNVNSKKR